MTPLLKTLACTALLGAAALTGCNTPSTTSPTSALTGSIDQSTFPAAIASMMGIPVQNAPAQIACVGAGGHDHHQGHDHGG
jgi:hypothetical protein